MPRTKGKFRTQAQVHFLTYPQCAIPKEEALRQLKAKAGEKYGWCVVSSEEHEERENDTNVGKHLHVIQEYSKKFETCNERYWDLVYEGKTYHPHFEPAKRKAKCLQYVIKDGDYIVDGTYKELPFNIDTYLEANGSKKQGYGFTYIATELKKGTTMDELDDIIPGHILNHKRKIEEYILFQEEKKQRATKLPTFYGFDETHIPNYEWVPVVQWANENFMNKRSPRQAQLWIWSREPGMGKTYPWAITMRKYKRCYEWLMGNKQAKEVLTCDYILIDELKGGITITELKSLSQMYGMNLDIKFGHPQFFNKNVPLIITSNLPPNEIYRKCKQEDINSLLDRFLVVEVTTPYQMVDLEKPKEDLDFTLSPNPNLESPFTATLPVEPDLGDKADIEFPIYERDSEEHSEQSNEEYDLFARAEKFRRELNK